MSRGTPHREVVVVLHREVVVLHRERGDTAAVLHREVVVLLRKKEGVCCERRTTADAPGVRHVACL